MQTLSSFDFGKKAASRKGKYDWAKLLDGGVYKLDHRIDFDCKPAAFIALARLKAKKDGTTIRAARVEDGVVIQALRETLPLPLANGHVAGEPADAEPIAQAEATATEDAAQEAAPKPQRNRKR